jgi:RNA polymerase subunit RPABC4/transcription elongation factor Spt4
VENTFETIRQILGSPIWGFAWKILLFAVIVMWMALVFWTLKDARKRIDDAVIVGVAVATSLVFPFIGTLVYTILRPAEYLADVRERELEMLSMEQELRAVRVCPGCREPVKDDYVVCPKCRHSLRSACGSCGRPLEYWWKVCPYCGDGVGSAGAGHPNAATQVLSRSAAEYDQETTPYKLTER